MSTMSRPKSTRLAAVAAVVALVAVALLGAPAARGSDPAAETARASAMTSAEAVALITAADGVLRFDVAEDATRFAWAGDPALEEGRPVQRIPFVSQGYIYPEGTLTNGNGVLADGSPEFPDEVLGQWSCYGWYLGGVAQAGTAPWLTTHLFNFGGAWGEATLVSDGYSIDELGVPLERAITGGTGPFAGASGMQAETNLGFNPTEGMNFRYELRLAAP